MQFCVECVDTLQFIPEQDENIEEKRQNPNIKSVINLQTEAAWDVRFENHQPQQHAMFKHLKKDPPADIKTKL